jgi:hypothetical protein
MTSEELQDQIDLVKNETTTGANTKSRVGGIMQGLKDNNIPLSGTTEDNPVTGEIHIGEISEGKVVINKKSINMIVPGVDQDNYGSFNLGNGGMLVDGFKGDEEGENIFVGLTSPNDYSNIDLTNKLIYAQRSYVDKANSYSTDETLTGGTWIDDKPIYRKVIQSTTINGVQLIDISALNVKDFIKPITGMVASSSTIKIGIPFSETQDSTGVGTQTTEFTIKYVNTNIRIEYYKILNTINDSKDYLENKDYYLTLEYTKKTD